MKLPRRAVGFTSTRNIGVARKGGPKGSMAPPENINQITNYR